VTLDDLEHQNRGFYRFFWRFWAVTHILRANYAKINRDRQGQAAYEIFSIERKFRKCKSYFLGSRKPAHECIKEQYPRKSRYFTAVGQPFMKMLQIGMGKLLVTTSTSDRLFSHINIDDFERA